MATTDGFTKSADVMGAYTAPNNLALAIQNIDLPPEIPSVFQNPDTQAAAGVMWNLAQQGGGGMFAETGFSASAANNGNGKGARDKKAQQDAQTRATLEAVEYARMEQEFSEKTGGISSLEWLRLSRTEKEANIREHRSADLEAEQNRLRLQGIAENRIEEKSYDNIIAEVDAVAQQVQTHAQTVEIITNTAGAYSFLNHAKMDSAFDPSTASDSLNAYIESTSSLENISASLEKLVVQNGEQHKSMVDLSDDISGKIEYLKNASFTNDGPIKIQIERLENELVSLSQAMDQNINLNVFALEAKTFIDDNMSELSSLPPQQIMIEAMKDESVKEAFATLAGDTAQEDMVHQAAAIFGIDPALATEYLEAQAELAKAEAEFNERARQNAEMDPDGLGRGMFNDPMSLNGIISPIMTESERERAAYEEIVEKQAALEAIEEQISVEVPELTPDELQLSIDNNRESINAMVADGHGIPEEELRQRLQDMGIPSASMDSAVTMIADQFPGANITPRINTPTIANNDIVPRATASDGPSNTSAFSSAAAPPQPDTAPEYTPAEAKPDVTQAPSMGA